MTTQLIKTPPKRKTFVKIRDFLFILVLVLTIIFRRNNIQSFFETIAGQNDGEIVLYFFLFSIFLLISFYILTRRKKVVGILIITDESFTIQTKKDTQVFRINQLTNFKIKTSYFIPNKENVGLLSSYNNWLHFEYKGENYKYQFIIDSNYQGNQFEELMKIWKKYDSFTLINEK